MKMTMEHDKSVRAQRAAAQFGLALIVVAGLAMVSQSGLADRSPGTDRSDVVRTAEKSVAYRSVPNLKVNMQPVEGFGAVREASATGSLAGGACGPVQVTHSGSSFDGGSFTLQAGFVEDEIAIAVYNVPANEFPIRVDTAEMIFGTDSASVPTTTEWSFLVWQGLPSPGNLVATFSSDGTILPHIQLPPGTGGVNVQVAVDPDDPDQIFIFANPDNAFSIGYRIDSHNNQSGNGCLTSPPPASNAFPATDTIASGLSQPTLNWIFAIDCGTFGCTPGFSSFQNFTGPFGISCAPSGDWVMRATYTSLACTPPATGGCCLPAGFCEVMNEGECAAMQGLFLGEDVPCSSVNCINLFGACCYEDDFCETPVPQAFCIGEGGTWLGSGTDCSNDACGDPVGACCIEATGACDQFTEEVCDIVDGIWQGAGVQCKTIVCFPSGSCCLPDGSCLDSVSPEECEDLDGSFQGDGSSCDSASCPQPQGACCLSNGNCIGLTEQSCNNVAGSWAGPGTNCDDTTGSGTADLCEEPAPSCAGDLNDDGTVNVFDLLQLLENWGACPDCAADLNDDGTVNVFDLLLLLENWGSCD